MVWANRSEAGMDDVCEQENSKAEKCSLKVPYVTQRQPMEFGKRFIGRGTVD